MCGNIYKLWNYFSSVEEITKKMCWNIRNKIVMFKMRDYEFKLIIKLIRNKFTNVTCNEFLFSINNMSEMKIQFYKKII